MQRLLSWVETRSAPVIATVAMLVGGMAFSLFWTSAVHGGPVKLDAPDDLWSLSLSSSALLHGNFSGIYYLHDSALTSPPGFEVLLAPFLALGEVVGLSPHLHGTGQPLSMWLVIGPVAILIGSSALFAIDAIARYWKFSEKERLALSLVGGLAVANVVVGWGHPEDCVSLALVLWAALLLDREGSGALRRVSWLLGIAVAFQPLALLGVAPLLARCAWRDLPRLAPRLAVPSFVVLAPPLITSAPHALFVLLRQPFQPRYISLTPFTRFAPSLGPGVLGGGPTRLVAIALAAILAVIVCRRRHDLETVLVMIAVAFTLRLLLESELNWYYFWPVSALSLLLALRHSRLRFWLCTPAVLACIVLGSHRQHAIGLWWPAIIGTTFLQILTAVPLPLRRSTRRATGLPQSPALEREGGNEQAGQWAHPQPNLA